MQLDMMLTSFSENFLELLIPHKGSAASATGYNLCTVHEVVQNILSTALLGCTCVSTYLRTSNWSSCTLNYGRAMGDNQLEVRYNVLDNQCSLTCIQNHGTRRILIYFCFLSLTTIKLYSCWEFPKQLNTLTLGGIYIHGGVHNKLSWDVSTS